MCHLFGKSAFFESDHIAFLWGVWKVDDEMRYRGDDVNICELGEVKCLGYCVCSDYVLAATANQ